MSIMQGIEDWDTLIERIQALEKAHDDLLEAYAENLKRTGIHHEMLNARDKQIARLERELLKCQSS